MERKSLKVAIAAVSAGISVLLIVFANLLFFLMVTLLTIAGVCYYIVFEKAGIVHGFLCIAVVGAISFLFGVNTAQILNVLLIAPYAVLAYFIRKIKFDKIKTGIIRGVILAVFANLEFMAIYFMASYLIDLPVLDFIETLGGFYVIAAACVTIVMFLIDIVFNSGCRMLCDRIKIQK